MQNPLSGQLPELLDRLTADTPALWGRMNAQQMIEHLTGALRMSVGAIPVKVFTPQEKLAKAKAGLLSDRPLPQGYRAPFLPDEPLPAAFPNLDAAKAALLGTVKDFHTFYEEKGSDHREAHPIFGPLNYEEWIVFHNKHFRHHLSQFGVVERE